MLIRRLTAPVRTFHRLCEKIYLHAEHLLRKGTHSTRSPRTVKLTEKMLLGWKWEDTRGAKRIKMAATTCHWELPELSCHDEWSWRTASRSQRQQAGMLGQCPVTGTAAAHATGSPPQKCSLGLLSHILSELQFLHLYNGTPLTKWEDKEHAKENETFTKVFSLYTFLVTYFVQVCSSGIVNNVFSLILKKHFKVTLVLI